jgi:DNA-binding transcriptional ArsR family regulator
VPSTERPKIGNAIDFRIWDKLIEQLELDAYSSSVLLWLYRETHGRGMYFGRQISIGQIAKAIRISRRTVMRRLNILDGHGLTIRTRKHEPGHRNYAPTYIEVHLPPAPEEDPAVD